VIGRRVAAALLITLLAGCAGDGGTRSVAPPTPTPSPIVFGPPQYRALWVDAFHDGMKSPEQVEALVANAHRANLNALIVQVRKRGDAYFNQSIEPRASDIKGPPDFDPLAYLIRLAHAAYPRIEVHAWLNVFFVGETSRVYVTQGSVWGTRSYDGVRGGFLDPAVPEVQAYTHQIFMNVASHYDVDGLHMDYVRYPGVGWGYSPTALALFMKATGMTTKPSPDNEAWKAWRRTQVTNFVRNLHDDLQREHPGVKLSAALICYGGGPAAADWWRTSAFSSVFQDWRAWLANGYLDFGVPMNYDRDFDPQQRAWIDRWLAFEKDSGFANRVVTGVGAFLNYPEGTMAQIRRALAPSAHGNHVLGIAIYSYQSTSVYGSDDFYADPNLAAGLPRQPYFDGIQSGRALAQRARTFNDWFMTQLSQPDYYRDVQLGWVRTTPVFVQPAPVPILP
jgi:uncharacterized lipoprotein YddW (UPF0748 family)